MQMGPYMFNTSTGQKQPASVGNRSSTTQRVVVVVFVVVAERVVVVVDCWTMTHEQCALVLAWKTSGRICNLAGPLQDLCDHF